MPRPKLKNRKILNVCLGEYDQKVLDIMATRERRYLGEMIRIAICEAAERRGIQVEQPQVEAR